MVFFSNFILANYSSYEGTIGKNKAELYIEAYFKDDINIIYIDSETHEPKGLFRCYNKKKCDYNFTAYEYYTALENIDTITFDNIDFNEDKTILLPPTLEGDSKRYGHFNLEKKFDYDYKSNSDNENHDVSLKNNTEFNNIEFIQRESTKNYYFKTLISKKKGEFLKIVGINIYRKKDGSLLQTIDNLKDFDFLSFTSINTDRDANFDGKDNDFYISKTTESINERNVIDAYYSYDKKQNKFVYLNLTGRFITFDPNKKTATKKKICPIETYMNRVVITDLYKYTDDKKYFLTNSKCEFNKYPESGQEKVIFSRQCTKKERNFCNNASESLIDDYID